MSRARDASSRAAARTASDEGLIQIVDVVKQFGDTTAVKHVALSIARKEIFALLGSSGCGKSTLLRMLAGFEAPTAGRILIDGQDITTLPPYKRPVNMMFQSYALFPHMTVSGNVAYGLKQEGVRGGELRERVSRVLELVQMGKYANRKPHQLSGGQQQRVALARSLVKQPKLLLLDEPMSALDKQIRQRTQLELIEILEAVGVTCIMVTHDQEEAMTMADRVAVMSEGEIVQVGPPSEVYEFPNSRFSAQFIGSTNLFEGQVIEDASDHVLVHAPAVSRPILISHGITGPEGMAVAVSVRPERVEVGREAPAAPHNWTIGTVEQTAYMGAYTMCHVRLPSDMVVVANVSSLTLARLGVPEIGETVYLSWGADAGVVLTS
ncbi:ABC transporter ATP-binding protein [Robbsia andropogonis]|uniref:ABC transporter ATP-binding protein n=1 Tax=Robbsia andropogonis TaxID=28092 RepID=UPI0020A09DFE|nr:polyamine ABC transporter ATP-binding protein [Robbsia andropogonis]MCP1117545.1 polyamine ABC transporter ATP-binding protein [Robbsia andropogonis]MCP1127011.1 polyamine ABC transporter ATP-binding protein [Robbsia andropogonis]